MKRTNLEQVHIDQMADSDAAQWTAARALPWMAKIKEADLHRDTVAPCAFERTYRDMVNLLDKQRG